MNVAAASSMPRHTPSPIGRRFLVAGFVLSTLFTTIAGGVSSCVLADRQTTRTEKISEVGRFVKATEAFQPLMRVHIDNLVHGRSLDVSREALLKNIQEQHVLLDGVRAYVPEDLKAQAADYEETLVKTNDALKLADTPLTAGPLMQQVNDAIVAKQKLDSALRQGVGLPA